MKSNPDVFGAGADREGAVQMRKKVRDSSSHSKILFVTEGSIRQLSSET